ncbi:phage tail protein [Chlorobium sp. BLA1]|uniref:phage tail protein n=1 Tax=Candidatus Chlorobium masyuteum TaxID=2716876 RepID=UPI00141FD133|nr:phage tail protein [Candidatus Chlorobium masyuteum]NHQ59570.1 phage tail protein [Candidatus Chlorobium masyuteum]
MADDSSRLPYNGFNFLVSFDTVRISFQEVTGLDMQTEPIEYRQGEKPPITSTFATIKMPGIRRGHVILKKGVFRGERSLLSWFSEMKMNTIKRKPVTITMLDEQGEPVMVWKMSNAWPVKISSPDLKASGNEVAIESIELAHEGVTIE